MKAVNATFGPYLDWLAQERDASPHTVSGYRKDLAAFAAWHRGAYGEDPDPAKVTAVDLREYQGWLRNVRNLRPATINRRMKALKGWLEWCAKRGLAPRVPEFPRGVPEAKRAPQGLERADVNRLLREVEREANARDIALVRVMLSCGLRLSEACSLRISDVSLSDRSGTLIVRSGKGGRWREVPVPPEARKALRAWLAERERRHAGSEWLFPGEDDSRPLSASAAWRAVKKYGWKARIPTLKPHVLRHTCATNMLRAGAQLTEVAAMLGHARLDTTAKYTVPSAADLARAAERGGRRSRSSIADRGGGRRSGGSRSRGRGVSPAPCF
ncbi:MAG: tyrosine-type recombinase/integrase, partial [Clostridia bacterium]|nr:tyrosine-type recombinase/integrase [Clostridia bacterium]